MKTKKIPKVSSIHKFWKQKLEPKIAMKIDFSDNILVYQFKMNFDFRTAFGGIDWGGT